jgi:hypothetical protein
MRVMAAGVHHSHFFAFILRLDLRGERNVHSFRYRKSIYIGTKGNDGSVFLSAKDADDSGVGNSHFNFHTKILQVFRYQFGGSKFPVSQLRILVKIPPPSNAL